MFWRSEAIVKLAEPPTPTVAVAGLTEISLELLVTAVTLVAVEALSMVTATVAVASPFLRTLTVAGVTVNTH